MFRRLTAALVIGATVILGSAGVADAAKPKPKATAASSIAVDYSYGTPTLGQYVHFIVSYPDTVKYPRIEILCYAGTTLGWATSGPATDSFKLGGDSSMWQAAGGPASCTANLYYWTYTGPQTYNLLATTQFNAAG
jgi:hypothetical protein